jgi:hypothetical protein
MTLTIQNLDATLKALTHNADLIEQAAVYGLSQVALAIERQAKQNFQGKRRRVKTKNSYRYEPAMHVGPSGGFPNVITGNLRRSINTKLRHGFGVYTAEVGPSAIYGRTVEQGSPRWKSGVSYPYLRPAYDDIAKRADQIFTQAFKRRYK